MKKLLSLCLVLALALALAIPAAAGSAPAASSAPAVQVNGEAVVFPNGSPEINNGRTMVPMRAVLEALGATVDYDADTQTVTATLDDISLTHVIRENTIEMGSGEKLTMDTQSYIKNGSTLVPLRFFSQALGYEVYWDDAARTAVVIDKAACISGIDEGLTVLNALQASQPSASGNVAMDVDVSGEIKMLDGTSDDVLPFSAKMTALANDSAVNLSGSMDLSALAELAEDDPTAALLEDLTFEMICGESMWMNIPVLTGLLSGEASDSDVWLKFGDFDMSALTADTNGATIGGVLYSTVEALDADAPADIYADLTQAAGLLTAMMGDDTFVKNGDDYVWEMDSTASALLAEAIGEAPDSFALTMSMEIKADGSSSFSMHLDVEDTISMSLSGDSTDTSATVTCQMTVPEVCEMTVQSTATVAESSAAPVAAPPAGAQVIDLGEMLTAMVGAIGGADGPTAIFTTDAA